MVERDGRQEVDGHRIVPNPSTRRVPARIFGLALEKGWGSRRIGRALNEDASIPPEVKPISDEQVRLCLANTLYMGVLTYGKHCTGIVDDRVIRERVEPGEELIIEGFCEPIVSRGVFEAVGELRLPEQGSLEEARDRGRRMAATHLTPCRRPVRTS